MLKIIHVQESKEAVQEKVEVVVEELRSIKLKADARKVVDGIEESLTCCNFPSEYWIHIRTTNIIERLNREVRRRNRVEGSFLDGNSALMLVCAWLRHVAGTQATGSTSIRSTWRQPLRMPPLLADFIHARVSRPFSVNSAMSSLNRLWMPSTIPKVYFLKLAGFYKKYFLMKSDFFNHMVNAYNRQNIQIKTVEALLARCLNS